uniref:Mitogen-activated protein kinase n=1 Tax=Globisporangium ultimum (strain ATCC 200006 / CBS 805.95 / DAOM BR144) TaxID=431595 RepID=K3WG42_GLOUD
MENPETAVTPKDVAPPPPPQQQQEVPAASNNRKRKMPPAGPSAVGLSRGNKFVRPNPNAAGAAVVPQQGSIHTSDTFIDHQRAMFHADTAPTPHGPVANMPPTPAFGNRRSGSFGQTPDGFDSTPTDDGFPSNSSMGGFHSNEAAATDGGFENDAMAAAAGGKAHTTTPSPLPRAAPLNLRNFANWNVSSRYSLVRLLGKGSYGQVAEAFDTVRQKKVAIKKINNVFDQEIDCKRLYREIYILRHLSHPQVITLLDVIPPENYESFSDLYLVFEFVDTDLHKLIMSPQYLTIRHIQVFLYQLLCGLKYIHSANVIHRDMKPANILLNEDCTLMICDFGLSRVMESDLSMEELAKHLYSPKDAKSPTTPSDATSPGSASSTPSSSSANGDAPKFRRQLTKHVVTRWYRAPELILLQDYSFAVDMWSVGCIFAELLSMQVESCPRYQERVPLFPGRSCFPLSADRPTTYSDKLDQLNVIFGVIGTPNEEDIGALGEVKQYLRKLPKKEARDFREMYPGAPADSLDLLKQMLSFNPECRISVDKALAHPFLQAVRRTQSEIVEPNPFSMEFENVPLDKETLKARIFDEIKMFAERNNSR